MNINNRENAYQSSYFLFFIQRLSLYICNPYPYPHVIRIGRKSYIVRLCIFKEPDWYKTITNKY